jgi:sedoheptulose-bisphosphatase
MSTFSIENDVPSEIISLLHPSYVQYGLPKLLSHLFTACRTIGDVMRDGGYSSATVGSTNSFGDVQLDVDLKTDAVVFDELKKSGLVKIAASEENPIEIDCGALGEAFSVAFDPLDGSSIIEPNFAVGTIIGVWKGNQLLNR